MALTKAKVSFLEGLDGSVLTGAMPALDGSSLTGISGMTKVTSDPALNTNPSSGVGTTWVNKSSGEMFICTDATADSNVWVNIGGGLGHVHNTSTFQGEIAGFTSSGHTELNNYSKTNRISLINEGTSTEHGTVTVGRYGPAGQSSSTHGYATGGYASGTTSNIIDRFAFATSSNSTDHGDINVGRAHSAGHSSSTHGFVSGGYPPDRNHIDKFAFSSNTTSASHGTLITARQNDNGGTSSTTHGFNAGGNISFGAGPRVRIIDKFTFASIIATSDHGDLSSDRTFTNAVSSYTDGYSCSGDTSESGNFSGTAAIDKYSFASANTVSGHGNLAQARWQGVGLSGTTHGLVVAGSAYPTLGEANLRLTQSDRFSYASNTTATDFGDIHKGVNISAGSQY